MSGKLYLVATPIGNLADITLRALETLKSVDVIACEDTRHSLKLLNYYEIKKPLIAYHKFNEGTASASIRKMLDDGKQVALITDAGMPCVSDPGSVLVRDLMDGGYDYTVVPGASALPSAVALSGIEGSFTFVGFLEDKPKNRAAQMEALSDGTALVFYCAPFDLNKNLDYLYEKLGDRRVSLVKEITKIYENVTVGKLSDLRIDDPKGEYVIVVERAEKAEKIIEDSDVLKSLEQCLSSGMTKKDAAAKVSVALGLNKNAVYNLAKQL